MKLIKLIIFLVLVLGGISVKAQDSRSTYEFNTVVFDKYDSSFSDGLDIENYTKVVVYDYSSIVFYKNDSTYFVFDIDYYYFDSLTATIKYTTFNGKMFGLRDVNVTITKSFFNRPVLEINYANSVAITYRYKKPEKYSRSIDNSKRFRKY